MFYNVNRVFFPQWIFQKAYFAILHPLLINWGFRHQRIHQIAKPNGYCIWHPRYKQYYFGKLWTLRNMFVKQPTIQKLKSLLWIRFFLHLWIYLNPKSTQNADALLRSSMHIPEKLKKKNKPGLCLDQSSPETMMTYIITMERICIVIFCYKRYKRKPVFFQQFLAPTLLKVKLWSLDLLVTILFKETK